MCMECVNYHVQHFKNNLQKNSGIACEGKSISPMCASNGIVISCTFTKVKLAGWFGEKKKKEYLYTLPWMMTPHKTGIIQESMGYKSILHSPSCFLLFI